MGSDLPGPDDRMHAVSPCLRCATKESGWNVKEQVVIAKTVVRHLENLLHCSSTASQGVSLVKENRAKQVGSTVRTPTAPDLVVLPVSLTEMETQKHISANHDHGYVQPQLSQHNVIQFFQLLFYWPTFLELL